MIFLNFKSHYNPSCLTPSGDLTATRTEADLTPMAYNTLQEPSPASAQNLSFSTLHFLR